MPVTNRYPSLRRALGFVVFFVVAAALLAATAHFASLHRATAREVTSLQEKRDHLQKIAHRLQTERDQAESDERVIMEVLRHCRTAEDIPDFQSKLVVSQHHGIEKLCLYVPEGSHTLEISSSWKPAGSPNEAAEEAADEAHPSGEKTWNIPLLGASGYRLSVASERNGKSGPVRWELTSNHSDFETRTETIPLDGFSHRGGSYSVTDVIQFPNQVDRLSIGSLKAAPASPPGLHLMDAKLRGLRDDQQYQITFAVRLLSDGPACVSASDAQRLIILGREDLLLPYEGGGKYELRPPSP